MLVLPRQNISVPSVRCSTDIDKSQVHEKKECKRNKTKMQRNMQRNMRKLTRKKNLPGQFRKSRKKLFNLEIASDQALKKRLAYLF